MNQGRSVLPLVAWLPSLITAFFFSPQIVSPYSSTTSAGGPRIAVRQAALTRGGGRERRRFDIPQNKLADSAERVVDRALEEARRREHALLTNEHVCLAFAQVEWDMFGQVMRDLGTEPARNPAGARRAPAAAAERARPRAPRRAVDQAAVQAGAAAREPLRPPHRRGDRSLLGDLRGDAGHSRSRSSGATASSRRRWSSRLATRMRDHELREERLKKRFELPPFLKHFATNLNQLARQDKVPPVFGRDRGDGSGARDPLPSRARQLGAAARRAGRRQDRDRRRPRAADRVRAGDACRSACATARSSTCR